MSKSDAIGDSMGPEQWKSFESFAALNKRKFQQISNSTRGEHSPSDVVNEAILVAHSLHVKQGLAIDFDSSSFQYELFRHLYQHLVRYTETNVRYAVKLDHGVDDDEPHPLVNILPSDDGRDPLALLLEKEAALGSDANAENHPSLAAAYVRLLDHCNHQMGAVASHLLLSISYTYKQITNAKLLAIHQQPMPLPMPGHDFVPGPWRRFKLRRKQIQLALDFGDAEIFALP